MMTILRQPDSWGIKSAIPAAPSMEGPLRSNGMNIPSNKYEIRLIPRRAHNTKGTIQLVVSTFASDVPRMMPSNPKLLTKNREKSTFRMHSATQALDHARM